MNALWKQVRALAPWALGLALLHWLMAWCVGVLAHGAALGAGDSSGPPDDRLLANLIELVQFDRAVAATTGAALLLSTVLGWSLSLFTTPLLIARLGGHTTPGELGARWLTGLGPSMATTAWHLLLRGAAFLALWPVLRHLPGWLGALLLGLTLAISQAATDFSRAQVILCGARGRAFATARKGFVGLAHRPAALVGALAASAILWVLALGGWAAVTTQAEVPLWPARVTTLLAAIVSLARLHGLVAAATDRS